MSKFDEITECLELLEESGIENLPKDNPDPIACAHFLEDLEPWRRFIMDCVKLQTQLVKILAREMDMPSRAEESPLQRQCETLIVECEGGRMRMKAERGNELLGVVREIIR